MNLFKPFRADVQHNDTQSIDYGPFTIRATVVPDYDTSPTDFDCYSQAEIDAYNRGDWQYVGVVLSIYLDDIPLDDHAASLWGVDCNYNNGNAGSYIADVANDLLLEATDTADKLAVTLRDKFAAA